MSEPRLEWIRAAEENRLPLSRLVPASTNSSAIQDSGPREPITAPNGQLWESAADGRVLIFRNEKEADS